VSKKRGRGWRERLRELDLVFGVFSFDNATTKYAGAE
jgi:hypothetical protein